MAPTHQTSDKSRLLYFIVFLFIFIWFSLLMSVMDNKDSPKVKKSFDVADHSPHVIESTRVNPDRNAISDANIPHNFEMKLKEPRRYELADTFSNPAPMAEIERNMTLYLTTLHRRLTALAGPTVDALEVWETFLEVTRDMPMTWDEQNAYRFPKPRSDGSIFVSLGTYRDPFCPMTIKSLYKNAKHPEKVIVGMFQQNCFGPKCRTGMFLYCSHWPCALPHAVSPTSQGCWWAARWRTRGPIWTATWSSASLRRAWRAARAGTATCVCST